MLFRSVRNICSDEASSFRNTPSVISSSSRCGASPDAASALVTIAGSAGLANWIGETLTATRTWSGQPAASMPAGLTTSGLPVGLQIVGPRHADALVLRAARAFESTQPRRRPDLAKLAAANP